MILYLFITALLAIICIQEYRVQHYKTGSTWYKARSEEYWAKLMDTYDRWIADQNSPRQRKLEKAYRAQLKKQYRRLISKVNPVNYTPRRKAAFSMALCQRSRTNGHKSKSFPLCMKRDVLAAKRLQPLP